MSQAKRDGRLLALGAKNVTAGGADESAAAFVESNGGLAGPDNFGLDGESSDLRMIERNDRATMQERMIVREADAGEGQVFAHDGGRFVQKAACRPGRLA